MGIGKRIGRAGIAALLVAVGLMGVANSAMATAPDDDASVETLGVDNVCTIDWGFNTPSSTEVQIAWDTTNLQWPTTIHSLGQFTITVSATGEPGNRLCGWNVSNSAFTNGSTTLLPATALQEVGTSNGGVGNWGISGGTQVALGSPGGGVNDPANQWSGWWNAEIDPVNPPSMNQSAPAGVYTSTITLTQTVGAP